MRTFAADLGIVPSVTLKHLRDMNKTKKASAPQQKERIASFPVGRERVIVWHYLAGKLIGLYQTTCSMYPDLGGMYTTEEAAMQRAHRIVSFHNRQLEIGGLV